MDEVVRIADVAASQTRSGNMRFVVRSEDGREFTTFREQIGAAAQRLNGQRARVEYHEQQRGSYRNVYLDAVEALPSDGADSSNGQDHSSAEAVAWETALEAVPWLVGSNEPENPIEPEELYKRLRPFKDLVADDIRQSDDGGTRETRPTDRDTR
jgi:hypothetical protein